MPRWILTGNHRRPRGTAHRVVAIGPREVGSFTAKAIQRGRLNPWIGKAQRAVVLLV